MEINEVILEGFNSQKWGWGKKRKNWEPDFYLSFSIHGEENIKERFISYLVYNNFVQVSGWKP